MNLYQIILKDIVRRKRRVLYAALGVVIATMTVVGILSTALAGQARIIDQIEKYGPNLTIVPAINNLDMKLGDLSLGTVVVGDNYIAQDKIPQIRKIADAKIREYLNVQDEGDIATIAPRLYVPVELGSSSVMLVGVDPKTEWRVRPWWTLKQGIYIEKSRQIVAGASAAELLKLKIGDKLIVKGAYFILVGVLDQTGTAEDYQFFAPLDAVQEAFGKEGIVSSIDVRALCNSCPVEIIADSLNAAIPGVKAISVKRVAQTEMEMINRVYRFMLALAGITLAVGAFGVANTMMTSVHERVKDIGIMRAVGASRGQIIRVFLEEAIIIGVIGGILGYLGGSLLAYVIGPLIFEGATVNFVPGYLPMSLAIAIVVAVIATAYPAFAATRIKVADSFRSL